MMLLMLVLLSLVVGAVHIVVGASMQMILVVVVPKGVGMIRDWAESVLKKTHTC
jgi:hypothetical protein